MDGVFISAGNWALESPKSTTKCYILRLFLNDEAKILRHLNDWLLLFAPLMQSSPALSLPLSKHTTRTFDNRIMDIPPSLPEKSTIFVCCTTSCRESRHYEAHYDSQPSAQCPLRFSLTTDTGIGGIVHRVTLLCVLPVSYSHLPTQYLLCANSQYLIG